ncbi:MAG: glycosyltransferase family 39 protein [Pseudomonadota bacterium]
MTRAHLGSPWWLRPGVIVAVALLLRLAWLWWVPVEPVADSVLYDAFAKSIADGRGYAFPSGDLTVYWPVGASAVYAVIYAIFGSQEWAAALFQALLGGAIVGLTWRLARAPLGREAAALAAWFTALWPLLIEFTTILASELLFIALVLAALNAWSAQGLQPVRRAVLWGALICAASYVRPTAWPLLVLFPLLAWWVDRQWRPAMLMLLVSVSTAAALFAPWVYRNYQLFDRFVLVAANGGPNLWMGNNPASNGGYMPLPDKAFKNEVERDRYYGREAIEFIKSHPLDYLKLSASRVVMTYDRETIGVVWNERGLTRRFGVPTLMALKLVSTAYWWTMLALGAIGAYRMVREHRVSVLWPLVAATLFLATVPILTVAQDRYHVPIDPLLGIFAAWGALGLGRRARSALRRQQHA